MRIANTTPWKESGELSEPDGSAPESAVLEAVADADRRHLLQYLLLNRYMVTRADAAEEVAARSRDVDRDALGDERRKGAELRLHHQHLPRLVEAGIVDYDETSEMISLRPEAEEPVAEAL